MLKRETTLAGGARLHLTDQGSGAPVLFLHGNPDTSDVWDAVITTVAVNHRCLAPDLPGFGRSGVPEKFDCSLASLGAWVDAAAAAIGLTEPVNLVMHDFGGLFGLAWAIRHPQKVRRLAILNTVFFPDYRWHFWARAWRTPLLGELLFALNTRRGLTLEMRRGSKALPAAYPQQAFDAITPSMGAMVLRLYRATDPANFAPWQDGLHALLSRVPAIVLWGDRDPYIDPDFADRFTPAHVHHFPDAGHWLPVEQPGLVAEHLQAFFR